MKFIFGLSIVFGIYVITIVFLVLKMHNDDIRNKTFQSKECVEPVPEEKVVRSNKAPIEREIPHFKQRVDVRQFGTGQSSFTHPSRSNEATTEREIPHFKQRVEVRQFGPGITGNAVIMQESDLTAEDKVNYDQHFEEDDFNGYLSDIISLYRVVEDTRPDICRDLRYPDNLPAMGVVIPFRNEHLSILLRTVYSILINTPDHLLTEIILVDDGSDHNELKSKLNIHVANLPKVQIIRLPQSVGLMMARQIGIEKVTAEIFACLDCHMEMSPGWSEPLLNRMLEKPRALLCSNMGSIDRHTFRIYRCQFQDCQNYIPAFLFNLNPTTFTYNEKFRAARTNDTHPLPFAQIQGMMIVMNKSWFLQLGGFDPGMKLWGSEQTELSIKVWTCGGTVEMMPCSFVAHMYRRNVWKMKDEAVANILRVAEVWLDEHKQRVYDYYKNKRLTIDTGDVSERKRIRKENNCKPFQTFLDTIKQFAEFEFAEVRLKGTLKNLKTKKCFDVTPKMKVPIQDWCHGETVQYLEWMESGRVRFLEKCLLPGKNNTLMFDGCLWDIRFDTEAVWQYGKDSTLMHMKTQTCVTAEDDASTLRLKPCSGDMNQKWDWSVL